MASTSDGDGQAGTGVNSQLASLVPSFDPSKDDLQTYQKRVQLVLAAWPKTRITELVMRLILNCQGSAFDKLQLHQTELMENDEKAVQRIITLLGGHWGKIGLEKQYEDAESALFHTSQHADESNDSYLARADVAWSKLLSRKLEMKDLQAYILLRGSTLSPEEKKKVILESDQSLEGQLTVSKVAEAIRILGATFFNDMTGNKKTKTKVYSAATLVAEDEEEEAHLATQEELGEDEMLECLLSEGDPDATLVTDFENAVSEIVQEDTALAAAYTSYQDARRRLADKSKYRGFWPVAREPSGSTKGKSSGNKGGGKNKGSWPNKPRRSLQDRILNSTCRLCNRRGHWKAECPFRQSGSTAPASSNNAMPTTTVVVGDAEDDILPMEFVQLPEMSSTTADPNEPLSSFLSNVTSDGVCSPCYMGLIHGESYGSNRVKQHDHPTAYDRLRAWLAWRDKMSPTLHNLPRKSESQKEHGVPERSVEPVKVSSPFASQVEEPSRASEPCQSSDSQVCFATHSSYGILDLGASKTVIGSECLPDLIRSLDASIRKQLTRCPCHVTFRFGNEATLSSRQALVIPIGKLRLKVAIVPGGTPFLLSNTLMRVMEAKIDCSNQTLSSKMLCKPVSLQLTGKGLFLIDVNHLVQAAQDNTFADLKCEGQTIAETFVSDGKVKKTVSWEISDKVSDEVSQVMRSPGPRQSVVQNHVTNHKIDSVENETERNHQSHVTTISKATDRNWYQSIPVNQPKCSAAQRTTGENIRAKHPSATEKHVAQPAPSPSSRTTGGTRDAKSQSPDSGGFVCRDSDLRSEVPGMPLPGHLEDQEWVQFMVSRYSKSTKESHRRYLRYVELKVEALEQSQETVPSGSNPLGVLRSQAKAKAMARPIGNPINTSLPDGKPIGISNPRCMPHRLRPTRTSTRPRTWMPSNSGC